MKANQRWIFQISRLSQIESDKKDIADLKSQLAELLSAVNKPTPSAPQTSSHQSQQTLPAAQQMLPAVQQIPPAVQQIPPAVQQTSESTPKKNELFDFHSGKYELSCVLTIFFYICKVSVIHHLNISDSLVAEVSALRQYYISSGGNDPELLMQLNEMLRDAELSEKNNEKKYEQMKPDQSAMAEELLALEAENLRLQNELMLREQQAAGLRSTSGQ